MKHALALIGVLAASGLLAQSTSSAPPDAQLARSARLQQSILRMAGLIEREVLRLPQYGLFDEIRFTIGDDVVTLRGFASRPTLKSSAEQAIRKIEGVKDVVNEIEVLPVSTLDEDIRFRAYQAIYLDPWLSRYNPNRGAPVFFSPGAIAMGISLDPPVGYHPIHIIVRNGNVKLTGVVATAGDKILAGIRVNTLPSVFKVENELAVAEEAKPIKGPKSKAPAQKQ